MPHFISAVGDNLMMEPLHFAVLGFSRNNNCGEMFYGFSSSKSKFSAAERKTWKWRNGIVFLFLFSARRKTCAHVHLHRSLTASLSNSQRSRFSKNCGKSVPKDILRSLAFLVPGVEYTQVKLNRGTIILHTFVFYLNQFYLHKRTFFCCPLKCSNN